MFGIQFYPTPPHLVAKMYDKVKWYKVRSILEPSAGKGDIVEGFRQIYNEKEKEKYSRYDILCNKVPN